MSQNFVAKKMFQNLGCLFSSSTSATFGGNFCRNKSCWFGGYHTLPICEKKSATEYLKGFRISVGYIILISTKNYRRKIFFRACFLLSRTPSRGRLFCILFSLRIVYGLPFIWPHRLMFLAKGFFRNNFSLPIYTHLENCYDMTIILINVSTIIIEAWEKHQKQHKCLIQHPELINIIFDLQNFLTSSPIPSWDPKVLSLPDPISSRSKKKTICPLSYHPQILWWPWQFALSSFARFALS